MNAHGAEAGTPVLQLAGIRQTFRTGPVSVDVLQGVDLRIEAGDLVAIMGQSGSGKSTLMNIIGLLDRPQSGTYTLKGREVGTMSDDALAWLRNAAIGFVFQSFHLLPRLSAWQNAGLPLVYRGAARGEIRRRASAMLERVGLADRIEHHPNELSGGQRQRVAIARALVGEPEIVLADEPTGALDAESGVEIMTLLAELNESRRTTTIIITHDYAVARRCRRRLRLEDGRLVETSSGSGRP